MFNYCNNKITIVWFEKTEEAVSKVPFFDFHHFFTLNP